MIDDFAYNNGNELWPCNVTAKMFTKPRVFFCLMVQYLNTPWTYLILDYTAVFDKVFKYTDGGNCYNTGYICDIVS